MSLPLNFVLIRHGLSERNRLVGMLAHHKTNDLRELTGDGFLRQHDAQARLTLEGVRQAETAGQWLRDSGLTFQRFYTSPHTRTMETAAHLHLQGEWKIDDRFRERDWGIAGTVRPDYAPTMNTTSLNLKELNFWYWKPEAGESLATGVRSRAESILESLYRKQGTENAIAVTHGEFILTMQFLLENLTPEQFNERWGDGKSVYKIPNASIVQYSRQDPTDPTHLTDTYRWRRHYAPSQPELSWDDGEWVTIPHTRYSDEQLLAFAESSPRVFSDERFSGE